MFQLLSQPCEILWNIYYYVYMLFIVIHERFCNSPMFCSALELPGTCRTTWSFIFFHRYSFFCCTCEYTLKFLTVSMFYIPSPGYFTVSADKQNTEAPQAILRSFSVKLSSCRCLFALILKVWKWYQRHTASVSITPVIIISALQIELQWSCCRFLLGTQEKSAVINEKREGLFR